MEENYQSKLEKSQDTKDNNRSQYKDPKIDFWSSRGNMGEKINYLVSLNLLLINLLSNLVQSLYTSNLIDSDLSSELERIKNLTSNMVNQPSNYLDLGTNISEVDLNISAILKQLGKANIQISNTQSNNNNDYIEQMHINVGIFNKTSEALDKWGILESIESLMVSYKNLSHFAFPRFYLSAIKEILHYEINEEYSYPNQQEVLQVPVLKIKTIISKLLREAPAARLLQNLYRLFPLDSEEAMTSIETSSIQDIVEKYFLNISYYLKGDRTLEDSIRASKSILGGYNLGTGDLESRIPNVSFIVAKDVQSELELLFSNDFKQLILSETIILIHRLNNVTLHNERFVNYLKRLK